MLLPRILWTDVVFRSIHFIWPAHIFNARILMRCRILLPTNPLNGCVFRSAHLFLTNSYFQRAHPHALCLSLSFVLDVQLVWPWNYFSLWRWSWDIESPPLFVVFMFVNDVIIHHFASYAASLAAFHPWLWNLVLAYIGYHLIFVGAVLLETIEINGTSAFRWCYLTTFVAFVVSNRMYLPWLGAQKKLSVVRRLMEVRNR